MDTAQMNGCTDNGWMGEQNAVHPHDAIVFSREEAWSSDTQDMAKP